MKLKDSPRAIEYIHKQIKSSQRKKAKQQLPIKVFRPGWYYVLVLLNTEGTEKYEDVFKNLL